MDRLAERLTVADKALATLGELTDLTEPQPVQRDAAIKRFEYSFEAIWKAAQHCLRQLDGIEVASPKGVIRACRQAGVLSDPETAAALAMADDRNLATHTYNEVPAVSLYRRLGDHRRLLEAWLERLSDRARAAG
jgi:nucleotidyltransferase substrate binding protein (TIGR01987 family)